MINNKKHKISIITVVKNNVGTIEKCLKSVIHQNYENIEYIVIDSNSSDGTSEIIRKYEDRLTFSIREPDNGIWDAMNKGLKLATGDIVGFLNADDFYFENALDTVNKYFINKNIDFLFGSVEKYKLMHGFKPYKIYWSFGFYTSHSVGFFIKTIKHKEIGFYNIKYLSSDLDFFYKMITKKKLNGTSTRKDEILGKFMRGGFSSGINYIDHLKDLNNIRIDNGQNKYFVYLLFIFKIIKRPVKFFKALKN